MKKISVTPDTETFYKDIEYIIDPYEAIVAFLPAACSNCLLTQQAKAHELAWWLFDSRINCAEQAATLIMEKLSCTHDTMKQQ